MTDPDRTGVYRATFTDTAVPEQHVLYVTAQGVTADGVEFRREAKVEVFVLVRPIAAATVLSIRFTGATTASVTAFPRDQFGNVLLVDPPTAAGFGLIVQGGTVSGPLVSNLDGSYTTTVGVVSGADLSIGLQAHGEVVVAPKPVPLERDLHFADEVVSFRPGPDRTANQQSDPADALGAPGSKPPGRFVSLGGNGVLTVAVRNCDIVAAGGNDVTVFVHRDTDPRSYRVEAYSVPDRSWRSLGESPGVTRSFDLGTAGLTATRAIRIADTSGRAVGADGVSLATPGVSVAAVGVRRIRRHRRAFGEWCWCWRFLRGARR
jgi:hypothetical protein